MFYCAVGGHRTDRGVRRYLVPTRLRQVRNEHGVRVTMGIETVREEACCPRCLKEVEEGTLTCSVYFSEDATKTIYHPVRRERELAAGVEEKKGPGQYRRGSFARMGM